MTQPTTEGLKWIEEFEADLELTRLALEDLEASIRARKAMTVSLNATYGSLMSSIEGGK